MRTAGKVFLLFFLSYPVCAQHVVSIRAGLISYAEGFVYLDQEPFYFHPEKLKNLSKDQSLRTDSGRAELQLGPAASLWMGEQGRLRLIDPDLRRTQLRLEEGSIFIEVIEKYEDNKISVHIGDSAVELQEIGLYRMESSPPTLQVFNGKAKVLRENKKVTVKKNKMAELENKLEISELKERQNDPMHFWITFRSHVLYRQVKFARTMELMQQQMDYRRYMQQIIFQQEMMELNKQQQREEEEPPIIR